MDIKGKKLLILGSTKMICTIVEKARELGVYTIVTDKHPYDKAPAKQIADEYYDIDFSDIEAVKKLVCDQHIDGVLTGFTDSYLPYYLTICEQVGFPCYGEKSQIDIATDKSIFKMACLKAGLPVIPGISAKIIDDVRMFSAETGFPIMLKPADNSGSRGVIRCDREDDLTSAYEYAMSFSPGKTIIAEKYMDCDSIAISYFAADGFIRLSTTDDRWVYKAEETGSSISAYSEYPSMYTDRYISEMNDTVIKMLRENGFNNGMVSLQAFVDERSFYFCEMCFRPSGGQHYILTRDQNEIDQLALLIEFAVTGKCRENWAWERESPFFKDRCAILRVIGIPDCRISKMEGFDKLAKDPRVIKVTKNLFEGKKIGKAGTTEQVIGSIYYRFRDTEKREEIAAALLKQLTIEDESGKNIAGISMPQRGDR